MVKLLWLIHCPSTFCGSIFCGSFLLEVNGEQVPGNFIQTATRPLPPDSGKRLNLLDIDPKWRISTLDRDLIPGMISTAIRCDWVSDSAFGGVWFSGLVPGSRFTV